jgi:hypothetical protein
MAEDLGLTDEIGEDGSVSRGISTVAQFADAEQCGLFLVRTGHEDERISGEPATLEAGDGAFHFEIEIVRRSFRP